MKNKICKKINKNISNLQMILFLYDIYLNYKNKEDNENISKPYHKWVLELINKKINKNYE